MKTIRLHCLAALALLVTGAVAQPAAAQSSAKPTDCAATHGPLPSGWSGTAFAIDGDTLAGVGLKPRIRIWGIQAPELRDKRTGQETVPGMRSRAFLVDMLAVAENRVSCRVHKFDRYCRLVAQCVSAKIEPSVEVGQNMIAAGYAYGYWLEDALPWDADAGRRYDAAENRARRERAGLWPTWAGVQK